VKIKHRLYVSLLGALTGSLVSFAAVSGQAASNPAFHSMKSSVPAALRSTIDQGPADAAMRLPNIQLLLLPTTHQQLALSQLLSEQRTPGSPFYEHWLTPSEFGKAFGVSSAGQIQLRSWLASEGFSNIKISNARTMISFSGTVASASRAFNTDIHIVSRHGELHFSNVTEISIPQRFSSIVAGVRGLDDFRPVPHAIRIQPQASPQFTMSYGAYGIAPGDIATLYGLRSLYAQGITGSGITAAVVGQTDIDPADIAAYQNGFNLPENPPRVVLAGSADPGTPNGDLVEADLDLELLSAVARGARIIYVNSANVLNSLQYAIDQNLAQVVSVSYGLCESAIAPELPWYQLLAEEANAQGMTLVSASGDAGAADCDATSEPAASDGPAVDFPSDIPEFSSIGGTSFIGALENDFAAGNSADGGSALSYIPEEAWNMTSISGRLEASGGGASNIFPKPSWQQGSGVPSDGHRDVPDLAFFSLNPGMGYIICTGGNCASGPPNGGSSGAMWGGTSAAAPVFAGIVALLNNYLLDNGKISSPGLGNINPELYLLASTSANVFHDVTQGSNTVPCVVNTPGCAAGSFGYAAQPGFDQATGLGSVDASALAGAWSSAPLVATTLSLASSSEEPESGSTIMFIAKAAPASAAVQEATPSGEVVFYSDQVEIGSAALNESAIASLSTTLPAGTHTIVAAYQGDQKYGASLSPVLIESVLPGTITTLSIDPAPSQSLPQGSTVTLTADVVSSTGSPVVNGSVNFYSGTMLLGSVPVSNGSSVLVTDALPLGSDALTAQFSGAGNFGESSSTAVSIVVSQPLFTLNASPSSLSVTGGSTASTTLVITPASSGKLSVSWSCSGLTATQACTFGAPAVQSNGTETIPLTISTSTAAAADNHAPSDGAPWLAVLPFALCILPKRRWYASRATRLTVILIAVIPLIIGVSGCGASPAVSGESQSSESTHTITVTATNASGYTQHVSLTLQITQ
jgi:Pro-kumamolisin, activation domain/Bacterial Ig-like domain (group 3)